jgi:hypothetical protein
MLCPAESVHDAGVAIAIAADAEKKKQQASGSMPAAGYGFPTRGF